jgi:hypothetical protein
MVMDAYLTFTDYQQMGGKLSELQFTRAEMGARMLIDQLTFNKLHGFEADDPIWDKVKFLVMELITRGYLGRLDGGDVTSESNDGRSKSYESRDGKAENLIRTYLPSLVSQGITMVPAVRG